MAYLDDELAAEERRELELHLLDCAELPRSTSTASAPSSTLVRERARRAARAGSAQGARSRARSTPRTRRPRAAERTRWSRWLLPGSRDRSPRPPRSWCSSAVEPAGDASGHARSRTRSSRQQTRALPLEVQGASTGPWLQQHFAPTVDAAAVRASPASSSLGARLHRGQRPRRRARCQYAGHDRRRRAFDLSAVVIRDLRRDELPAAARRSRSATARSTSSRPTAMPAVTYVDANHIGYVFMSEQLIARTSCVRLVVSSDLIAPRQQDTLGQ